MAHFLRILLRRCGEVVVVSPSNGQGIQTLIECMKKSLLAMEEEQAKANVKEFLSFINLPVEERALLHKIVNPTISDKRLAEMLGIHRETLAKMPAYRRIKQALIVLPNLPHGTINEDGFIESYLRPEGRSGQV